MKTFLETPSIFKDIVLLFTLFLLAMSIRNFVNNVKHVFKKSNKVMSGITLTLLFIFISILLLIYHASFSIDDSALNYTIILNMPLAAVLVLLGVFSVIVIDNRISLANTLKNNLSEMSIKESVDELPTGICYYDENGVVLLANDSMNEDSILLTGHRLLNGNNFWNMLNTPCSNSSFVIKNDKNATIVIFANSNVKSYKRYTHTFNKNIVYEIIGSDISEEYHLFEQYQSKKEQLQIMNNELKQYGNDVNQLTVEREILEAKIKIHNDLGKILLQTKLALEEGLAIDEVLKMWNEKIQLFAMVDKPAQESNRVEDLIKVAHEIGVNIVFDGYRPRVNTAEEKILAQAIHISLTNVVLHANGKNMNIKSIKNGSSLELVFTNDGKQPEQEIKEGGGLSSLRSLVEKANGKMIVNSMPYFELKLFLNYIDKKE